MSEEDAVQSLPPLREVIAAHDLSASKRLGQHFLFDLNITDKIARSAGCLNDVAVWEVGPGPGGLTRALLNQGASKVFAIEKDRRFTPALEQLRQAFSDRLDVIMGDSLEVDETDHVPPMPCKIIANLPFNIATALLLKWLSAEPWPPWFESLTLMFQKEVADRLSAEPGTRDYGRLTVAAQWRCRVQRLFDVPARAFTPAPKVQSTVVHLTPRASKTDTSLAKAIETIARAAFGQRRKMLRTSLRPVFSDTEYTLGACHIDPTKRAEDLTVNDYETLGKAALGRI